MTSQTHRKLLYSLFLTGKRNRLNSAKGSDARGRVQESFKDGAVNCPLPMESWTPLLSREQCVTVCMGTAKQGNSLKSWYSEALLGLHGQLATQLACLQPLRRSS